MISYGNGQRRRLKRAEKYLELCGTKMYGVITEMARYTGKSVRYVKKDLRKMLKAGMFPNGHLDDKETCFMLNDVIYHQYLETEKAYLEQKKSEEQAKQMPDKGTAQDAAQTEGEQELHSMVAEGMECIRHLRDSVRPSFASMVCNTCASADASKAASWNRLFSSVTNA